MQSGDIEQLRLNFHREIQNAKSPRAVEDVKNKFLGRKHGLVTRLFNEFTALPLRQKQQFGPALNKIKSEIEAKILAAANQNTPADKSLDLSIPASGKPIGHLHPLTQAQNDLENIFRGLGFSTEYGYEIENDWYNFTALNFPPEHPARDSQDTFFIKSGESAASKEKLLLRTHTSPMQVRFMEKHEPPFAIIVPGPCYRNEATDATHEHTFNQLEGLMVGEGVNFANMVWTLDYVLKKFFGSDVKTKLLPAYFPFVEPGAEMALSSPRFKNGKWVELFGCGMVHQNVFSSAGYAKNKYQGFAFGFGIDRFSIMKYGIPDIRLLRENNLNFLTQF